MIVLGATEFFQNNDLGRNPNQPEFRYFFSEITFFGRGNRFFNWFRKLRFGALVRKIEKIIKTEKITHVVGVYPNEEYCLAASRAARNAGVSFSSYFHNTYVENVAITDPKAGEIQSEIFESSDHVFVMSNGMKRFYEKKYQLKKFIPLVHTFDEYPVANSLTGIPGKGKKEYKLVAIGNFNESNLDATRRLLRAIKNEPKFSFHVYTHVPELLLRQRGLDTSQINHHGSVSPEQIHEELQKYDLCVLTHGFTGGYGEVEYQTIFPTRTIPFLLSGKPIFAHSPKGSFLNDFIKDNQCAVLADEENENDILKKLNQLCDDENRQEELVAFAKKASDQFYGRNVAEELKQRLLNG